MRGNSNTNHGGMHPQRNSSLNSPLSFSELLCIYLSVSLIQCYDDHTSEEFIIQNFPPGLTCTVHLKYFHIEGLVPRDIVENLVTSNINSVIFTIWSKVSLLVKPILNFFEECSINILIDRFTSLRSGYVPRFLYYTYYGGRGPLHSVYILINWECTNIHEYESRAVQMEMSLFLHIPRFCKDFKDEIGISAKFPTYSLVPFPFTDGTATAKGMFSQMTRSDSIFVKPSLPTSDFPYTIDCASSLGKGNGRSCFKNVRLKHCNSYRQIFLGHLEGLMNFTCRYIPVYRYSGQKGRSYFGSIILDGILNGQAHDNMNIPEGTTSIQIMYCDFTHIENRLELRAWIKPMGRNAWITLVLTILICAALCCVQWNQNQRTLEIKISCLLANSIVLFGIVLRQYSTKIRLSILFTTFALAALTLTSMYETEITVEILAPRKPSIIKDLAELIHEQKYRLLILAKTVEHKAFELEYLRNYMKLVNEKRTLTEKNVEFFGNSNSSLFGRAGMGDKSKRMAMFDQFSLDPEPTLLSVVRKRNPKLHCNYVKRPLGNDWILAMFSNNMGLTQIKLFKCFLNSGLTDFWKSLVLSKITNSYRTMHINDEVNEIKDDKIYITLENLISILTSWGTLLAIAFFVLILEILVWKIEDLLKTINLTVQPTAN
jgi:hypothetical protein